MAASSDAPVPAPAAKKPKVRGGDAPPVFQLPGEDCPICLAAPINCNDKDFAGAIRTPCGHLFHRKCIQECLHASDKCPMCCKPLIAGDLQTLETVADGQLVVPFPARDGVLATLMRAAATKNWSSKAPSPPCTASGIKYVMWHSYREELETSILHVQAEDNLKAGDPSARHRNKLGITLNVKGKVTLDDPHGSHTIGSLMVDNHPQVGPAREAPLPSDSGAAPELSFEVGCRNWIRTLMDWEAVLTALFKERAGTEATAASGVLAVGTFTPYKREVAGPDGVQATYIGHPVALAAGCGYYRDHRGQIIVGYHGSTDPPVDMAGADLVEGMKFLMPVAPGSHLPGHSVNSIIDYLKLRLLLERVNAGHENAYKHAEGIEPIIWNAPGPTVQNPHLFTIAARGHQYVVWIARTDHGLGLTIQAGPDYYRKKRDTGKLGFMLDHRNMQIWYVLVNGKVVPDCAMPQNGSLMRGEWKVPGWGADVKFMGSVMGCLLKNIG